MSLDQQLTTPRLEAVVIFWVVIGGAWLPRSNLLTLLGVRAVQGFPQNREQGVTDFWRISS